MSKRQLFFLFLIVVWFFILSGLARMFRDIKQGIILVLVGLMFMPIYRAIARHPWRW